MYAIRIPTGTTIYTANLTKRPRPCHESSVAYFATDLGKSGTNQLVLLLIR